MGQAKQRGSLEDRIKRATKDHTQCDLLIIKRDTELPALEFQHGEVSLSTKPRVDRSDAINTLHNNWGHDGRYIQLAGEYISHSPSLALARSGIVPKLMLDPNTGRVQHIDLENLGCVIEFELEGKGITTAGPQWMTPAEVKQQADQLRQENQHTHSIRVPA